MQNYVSRAVCIFLLLMSSCIGDIISVSSAVKVEYPPKYDYLVNLGEDLIFNVNLNASGGFLNNSVYQEIDDWVRRYAASTENVKLENFNDSRGLFVDLFHLINHQIQIKVNVAKIKCIYENRTLSDSHDRISRGFDEITGSLLVWEPINETWITPFIYFHSQIDLIKPFFLTHFNIPADDDDLNDLISTAHDYIDTEFGLTYWQNYVIQRFQTSENYYYANGTKYPPEMVPNYDPLLPQPPLDLLNFTGIPFFFPTSMSFQMWADYLADLTEYALENPNNTIPAHSLSNLLDQGGITTFITNTHGLGIIMNSQTLNMSFIDEFLVQPVEQFKSLFAISVWTSFLSLSLEYDDNFTLASLAVYSDFITEFDTISKILNGSDLPYLYREPFIMSTNFSCVRDGLFPPTPSQIQNGEIGDDRDYRNTPTTPTTNKIAGFTLPYLGLAIAVPLLVLILRKRFSLKLPKSF